MSDDEKTVNFTGSHSPQAIARLGSVIGSFRLDDVLGAGGQGIVYKAWDLAAQRSVALKMLVDGESGKHEELLNEARKVSRLSHKNIVPLLYVTPESESPFCVVMEYVPGVTLAHVIDAEAPLPESAALALISDVAEGLAHAHSQGIIHLDVKPGNILLERDTGIARLSDFGMAIHHSERWNRAGGGTRMYMSPEQVLRKSEQRWTDRYMVSRRCLVRNVDESQALRSRWTFDRDAVIRRNRSNSTQAPKSVEPQIICSDGCDMLEMSGKRFCQAVSVCDSTARGPEPSS